MNKKYLKFSAILITSTFLGCGSSSSSGPTLNDGKGSIDLAKYYPTADITSKSYMDEVNGTIQSGSTKTIEVKDNIITYKNNGVIDEIVTIGESNITTVYGEEKYTHYRHVDIGERLFSDKESSEKSISNLGKVPYSVDSECILKDKLSKYEKGKHKYSGDILEIKCTSKSKVVIELEALAKNNSALFSDIVNNSDKYKDINGTHEGYDEYLYYLQKGVGLIAEIDNNCIKSDFLELNDDKISPEKCTNSYSKYNFYLPNK
jgi:hypothetical protein